jgi:hypothetical protein
MLTPIPTNYLLEETATLSLLASFGKRELVRLGSFWHIARGLK